MKYTSLRLYIRTKKLHANHFLEARDPLGCDLVIDGKSYFKDTYKDSGCGFVCGAECNKYADYLKDKLSYLIKSGTNCYVIFSGCKNVGINKKKEVHQRIVSRRSDDKLRYFEPAFVEDVQREVLKALDIEYTVCEYDSAETIIGVARKFKCPVITDNIEYCLCGVSCIKPSSVMLSQEDRIYCLIYDHEKARSAFGIYANMPLLLTLLNENGDHFDDLAKIIECDDDSKIVSTAVRWVRKQRKEAIKNVTGKLHNETERVAFTELYDKMELLYKYPRGDMAVKYFFREKNDALLFINDKKWFSKGVSNERIATPYVDLKKSAMFTGSQLMFDQSQPDAMIAAIDIISYSFSLLTNFQKSNLTFIGRETHSCRVVKKVNVPKLINFTQNDCKTTSWPSILIVRKKSRSQTVLHNQPLLLLNNFLGKLLPSFDIKHLEPIPKDSWILVISLLYYVKCINKDFGYGAYCILLCYVLLGPVAKPISILDGVILDPLHKNEDCKEFAKGLETMFGTSAELTLSELNTGLLHSLSEFQHCLQHMNYLIRLCAPQLSPLIYHRTFNGAFVYNVYLRMQSKDRLVDFLDSRFKPSSVLGLYKKIVNCFESCLQNVKNTKKQGLEA